MSSVAEGILTKPQLRVLRDVEKDVVAGEEDGVEIERALGDMGVREGDVDPFRPKGSPEGTDVHPMLERSCMQRVILQQVPETLALFRREIAGQNLCDDERWQDQRRGGDCLFERRKPISEEIIDQARAIDGDGRWHR